MSRQWPPEWGEPDWEDQDQEDTAADSDAADQEHPESAAVIAALAALPMPALPDAVETRITTALAAEAAARATGTAAATEPTAARTLDTSQPRSRAPRRRKRRLRPVAAVAPAVAALLIGGFAYLLTLGGVSSSVSGPALAPASAGRAPLPAAEPANGSSALRLPAGDLRSLAPGERPVFVVTVTGTRYQQATLAPQLRQALATSRNPANAASAPSSGPSAATSVPSPASGPYSAASSASSARGVFAPSKTLAGCVLRVTGKVVPTLVEYATYQGKPVYVIVLPDRAWIVGVGCTASDPKVIVSVSLAG